MTATALRNTTVDWQASDAAHHLHPFTDHAELTKVGTRIITRAEGSHLFDSEGNRLLDAFAGLWCVNVGYGRQELAKAAYDQMLQLPYYNTFFKTTTPPAVEQLASGLVGDQTSRRRLDHMRSARMQVGVVGERVHEMRLVEPPQRGETGGIHACE